MADYKVRAIAGRFRVSLAETSDASHLVLGRVGHDSQEPRQEVSAGKVIGIKARISNYPHTDFTADGPTMRSWQVGN